MFIKILDKKCNCCKKIWIPNEYDKNLEGYTYICCKKCRYTNFF